MVDLIVDKPHDIAKVMAWSGRSKSTVALADRVFPEGTRILHHLPSNEGEVHGDGASRSVVFGIPMTPMEAVRRAQQLQHPFDTAFQTPDHVVDSMFQVLTKGTEEMHKERVRRLKWMKQRVEELETQEQELHANMEAKVAEVLAPKKLLLLAELTRIVGYGDVHLVEDMCNGVRITGEGRVTGCFAPECKPPTLDREDLWRGAKSAQQEVSSGAPRHMQGRQVSVAGNHVSVAHEVWEATREGLVVRTLHGGPGDQRGWTTVDTK